MPLKHRKAPKRYLNELLQYCPECNIIFTVCNSTRTFTGMANWNTKTGNVTWKKESLIEESIQYYCRDCGLNITNNQTLIPQNIISIYHHLFNKELPFKLDKSMVKNYHYMTEQIESAVFDDML